MPLARLKTAPVRLPQRAVQLHADEYWQSKFMVIRFEDSLKLAQRRAWEIYQLVPPAMRVYTDR